MTKLTVGLKKKSESGAKQDQQPDIELTEEDLKQIAGGTTKAVQTRLPGVRITE
jgi:bacteriocin-like protein